MNHWRMAFRLGSQGTEMWPDCYERGIAAIGYYTSDGIPVVEDCSELTEDEYDEIWKKEKPKSRSDRNSLKNLAYRMRTGDIIYVKQGPHIVGKGEITKEYEYDPHILKGAEHEWEHYVTVKWQNDFTKFRLVLGADLITVLKLEGKRLAKIREMEKRTRRKVKELEVKEGQTYKSETLFRRRNRTLIDLRKAKSDYRCEVCRMSFAEVYGDIGEEYIIAHHVNPIGGKKRASITKLDDIALVCSNCHDMLHRANPPLSTRELQRRIKC